MTSLEIMWYLELCERLDIRPCTVTGMGLFSGLAWDLPVETFADLPRMALTGQTRLVREECNAYLYNNGRWIRISAHGSTKELL